MNTRRLLVPSLFAFAAFQGTSYAALLKIGVNFLGRDNETVNVVTPNEVAGVVPQSDWNNLGNNIAGEPTGNFTDPNNGNLRNITSGPLFTDNGVADGTKGTSTVTVTVSTNDAWHSDGPQVTPNDRLMRGIVKAGNAQGSSGGGKGQPESITFHNLTPGTLYTLIAYGNVNNSNNDVKVNYTLDGLASYDSYYLLQPNQFGGTFIQGTNTVNADANRTVANYVQWTNIAPTLSGDLNFHWTWVDGGDGVGINGFQLLELPPVSTGDVYWNLGAGAGAWNTTATNWAINPDGSSPNALFSTNNTAHFTDLGTAGDRNITVDAAGVTMGGVDVTSASNYTIGGGALMGGGGLTKSGNATLNLTGTNTFTGNASIKHGTVNVATIGDPATAGNLGQGSVLNLGDTAGTNNAVLNYTGSTASVNRALAMVGPATFNVSTAGQNVSFVKLTGAGALTKGGLGTLSFGATTDHTGSILITAGTLNAARVGNGTGNFLSLDASTAFNLTGTGTTTDGRVLLLNGNATVGVMDATGNYALTGDVNTSAVLTKTGNGRLELAGSTSFSQLPVISAGTLALTKDGGVTLPSGAVNLAAGSRLEVVPGALTATNPVNLNGGSLRAGHQGLLAYIFAGGYDYGAYSDNMNSSPWGVASYYAAAQGTLTQVRTTAGGTGLTYGGFNGNAPFASLGVNDGDNVRAIFTGKIRIDSPGLTTFFTSSDDGSGIFIDGVRVVLNNNFQGNTTRQGNINLTAGLHDFLMYYAEGGGDAGLIAEYTPAGGSRQVIPNSVLYSGDGPEDYTAPAINITAPSTIESGAALAQFGALSLPANTLLTINGSARFAATTLTGSAHQVAVTGFNANSSLGVLSGATALTKTGNGNLVFLNAPTAGTTITASNGLIVTMGSNAGGDPLAGIAITFAGAGFGMSSTNGDVIYTDPVSSSANLTIAAGSFGNGNITAATNITYNPATLVAPTGNTLTLRVNDGNFTLNITPQITGTGAVVTEEGKLNLNGGVNNVGGNFTNRAANVTINGNLATNALLQQGNLPNGNTGTNFGDNLITGQFLPGSLTVTGTTNATGITTTRGTLNLTGAATNTGTLTGNGNGVMNLGASTHLSAALTNNATLNANGTFSTTGPLSVTGATANLNGVSSVGNVALSGGGTLKIGSSLATGATGISATQAANLNFDAGAGNTATLTGGDLSLDTKAQVRAVSGIADLSAVNIHSTVFTQTLLDNTLAARLYTLLNGARLDPRTTDIANRMFNGTTNPGLSKEVNLTGNLSFGDDNAFANLFAPGANVDVFSAAFVGRYRSPITGTTNLGTLFNDDQAAIWLDSNQDGVFQDNEKVVNVDGCCGAAVTNNTPTLQAGQYYNVLFAVQDTGGGSSLGASINGNTINPTNQPGLFSYLSDNGAGSNFQVDSGAELRVKSFDGVTSIRLANNGTLSLTNKASQLSSSAARIQLTGTMGTVLLGDNNVLTLGEMVFTSGSTLNIDAPAGANTGGRLVLNGSVTGFTGVHSNINGSSINIVGGALILNAPLDGAGVINASLSGVLGGNSSTAVPVNIFGSSTLSPGDPASNGGIGKLVIGTLTSQGNFAVQLKNKNAGNFDQLSVIGLVDVTNTNLALSLDPAFAASPGDQFPILLNDDTGGSSDAVFGQFAQGTSITVGVAQFNIFYDGNFDAGLSGNDVYLQYVIPEPGSVAILLGGVATLVGLRRTRRRS